ncbi:Anionic trypsin-1 [Platysternon megacephalum]|uniref:Anionic trypsin-1 n=1 Tax=Platysternon megacephalum TaxID=55544 RepID=A0A4D9ETV3_9SAUR|nr:Anionic trypsin-1 [Platysternon megacephalum]
MNYLALSLLLFLQLFSLIDGQNSLQRIIGGYIVAPHSSKYLVSLKRKTGFHFCGGSLVSRSWVLTAAHCKTEINQMMIVAGEYSLSTFEGTEQIFRPSRMVVHPDYSSASKNADIMLIKDLVIMSPMRRDVMFLCRDARGTLAGHWCVRAECSGLCPGGTAVLVPGWHYEDLAQENLQQRDVPGDDGSRTTISQQQIKQDAVDGVLGQISQRQIQANKSAVILFTDTLGLELQKGEPKSMTSLESY